MAIINPHLRQYAASNTSAALGSVGGLQKEKLVSRTTRSVAGKNGETLNITDSKYKTDGGKIGGSSSFNKAYAAAAKSGVKTATIGGRSIAIKSKPEYRTTSDTIVSRPLNTNSITTNKQSISAPVPSIKKEIPTAKKPESKYYYKSTTGGVYGKDADVEIGTADSTTVFKRKAIADVQRKQLSDYNLNKNPKKIWESGMSQYQGSNEVKVTKVTPNTPRNPYLMSDKYGNSIDSTAAAKRNLNIKALNDIRAKKLESRKK